jgi:hypothetical protein
MTVTIQLEPAYQLHAVEVPMTLEAVLSSLNTIIHSAGTSTSISLVCRVPLS